MAEELEAGRELDAMIAERVMGFVWPANRCPVCGWTYSSEAGVGRAPFNCSMRPLPPRRAADPAPYSTDLVAAWTVVERLNAADWLVVVKSMPVDVPFSLDLDTDVRSIYRRAVVQLTDMRYAKGAGLLHARHVPPTFADTAPLAICRAALLAAPPREAPLENTHVASTTTEEQTP